MVTCRQCPRRAGLPRCTNLRPPCRRHWLGGETNTGHIFFIVRLASTAHRGRVDARGRRSGGAPGLTRTSGQTVGVPSLDARACAYGARAWMSLRRVLGLMPALAARSLRTHRRALVQAARRRRRRASSLTTSNVGAQARRSRQARRRVSRLAAGIDAASMARQCHLPNKETCPVFVPPPSRCLRQGGRGFVQLGDRRDAGTGGM